MAETAERPERLVAGERAPEPEPRRGDDLIEAAATGQAITPHEEDALLAYFLGDAPQPNAGEQRKFTVDIGDGRKWTCTLRSIDWAEWQDAQRRALNTATGTLDVYVQASFVVTRAIVLPRLGAMLEKIREGASAAGRDPNTIPEDGPAMLRRFFAKQAGSLIYLQRRVLEMSRLDEAGEGGVKEVEAAKN